MEELTEIVRQLAELSGMALDILEAAAGGGGGGEAAPAGPPAPEGAPPEA